MEMTRAVYKQKFLPTEHWLPEETSSAIQGNLGDAGILKQSTVTQFLDPLDPKKEQMFRLYYFVKDQTFKDPRKPTILFAAGGPGQMIIADSKAFNFVDMYGYRVVYFHLRGTGFSQIPESPDYDRFVRTSYVVNDIERIREDLKIEQWSAIIGHSYGTVVAQRYASLFPNRVKKIVLSAAITPLHSLEKTSLVEITPFENLKKIYGLKEFNFLDKLRVNQNIGDIRNYLVDKAREIAGEVETRYWNMQFVADEYDRLEKQLKSYKLDYGAAFFGALRRLRHVGWLPLEVDIVKGLNVPLVDALQRKCGLAIAKAILEKATEPLDLEKEIRKQKSLASSAESDDIPNAINELTLSEKELGRKDAQTSARPYYVISIYDGLNVKFLRNLRNDGDFGKAIRKTEGTDGSNPYLDKVKIMPDELPQPWDPARKEYRHGVPTLILEGGADPINERGEAEYYFEKALTKDRALIKFPGVGHAMALPSLRGKVDGVTDVGVRQMVEHGEIATVSQHLDTRDALIHAFVSKTFEDFKRSPVLEKIKDAFSAAFNRAKEEHGYKGPKEEVNTIFP
jgi:pimeloyl-ACP methyl ester carboxylesterase